MNDEKMRTLAAQATAISDLRTSIREALTRNADPRLVVNLYDFLARLEAARDCTLEEFVREDARA